MKWTVLEKHKLQEMSKTERRFSNLFIHYRTLTSNLKRLLIGESFLSFKESQYCTSFLLRVLLKKFWAVLGLHCGM